MRLARKGAAEFLGTMGLLIVVVGSGIMGESLAQGNASIALLANSLATGAGLYALIQTFGQISGAHFNPAVSFVEFLWKKLSFGSLGIYTLCQVAGGYLGVLIAHLMFGLALFQVSQHDRSEPRLLLSEAVATTGLILVIYFSGKKNVETTPTAVSLYITSAYWCTSSTSFANPAVTIARSFSDTFAGIKPSGAPGFMVAQIFGALLAFGASGILGPARRKQ